MTRLALCLLLLATLAGCEPMTPAQAARQKLVSPMRGTTVEHDDARAVTCWKWSAGGGAGAASGLSCLPDWMLHGPDQASNERQLSPHEAQSEPTPALAPGRWIDERYEL
ncbi:hypothetical protein ACNFBR_17380 [Pseudomonas sp. NY11955]|uniref:hypothetical protein n=1 Tax=Pseudomonas sp. NY11955 TaxID=3400363 RepID=UPI003A87EA9A